MTASETWKLLKAYIIGQDVSNERIRNDLTAIFGSPGGIDFLKKRLLPATPGMDHIWGNLAWVIHPPGTAESKLLESDQQEIGNSGAAATIGTSAKDIAYWVFQWLRVTSNVKSAPFQTAERIADLFKTEACKSTDDIVAVFSMMNGWSDYPQNRWADLIQKALKAKKWIEFGVELGPVDDCP